MDVLDRMGKQCHPEEDHLERYVMKVCSEQEAVALEDHLFGCEQCRARLYDAEEYVALMKSTIPLGPRRLQERPGWRQVIRIPGEWQIPGAVAQLFAQPTSMAAGCAALAAVLLATPLLLRETAPGEELISLTATRGQHQSAPTASSHHRLRLRLDATDLTEPLEGQMVDVTGAVILTKSITQANPELAVDRPLKPGLYWVRINSRHGEHANLREFRIEVK